MAEAPGAELILIRHAAAEATGRLCGRTDVPASADALAGLHRLGAAFAGVGRRVSSPALRCRQTAAALWPGAGVELEPRLAEQDFGDWDGQPLSSIPDLGRLCPEALARHRPPGGESFADVCDRVRPALARLAAGGVVAMVAHAGTVRAGLALALGSPGAALAFEVAPLSVTRLRPLPGGGFSVVCVNCAAA